MNTAIARRRLIAKAVVLVAVMSAWLDAWLRHRLHARRCITYGPMHQRDQERQNNLRFIYESTDVECIDLLRMRRAPFMQLCDLFRTRQLLRDSIHSSVEEQVAMFLHVVGHNQRFSLIGTGVPDLPSGEGNYRFGGDVTQTIQLPINTTRTP
jgi:Zn ribbon nucleic-acid-binding protein